MPFRNRSWSRKSAVSSTFAKNEVKRAHRTGSHGFQRKQGLEAEAHPITFEAHLFPK